MRRVLAVTVCLLVVGCVSLKAQRLDAVVRLARTPESVAVLAEEPDQPYTVISRAVHIHPTVSELVPTLLQQLKPA